jgi:hypothetical protein
MATSQINETKKKIPHTPFIYTKNCRDNIIQEIIAMYNNLLSFITHQEHV